MGKWGAYKATLGKADPGGDQDPAWNDRVRRLMEEYKGLTLEQAAADYKRYRAEKERLEDESKKQNEHVEALARLLVGRMETTGITNFRVEGVGQFVIDDAPHSTVTDRAAFLAWVREAGLEDMLTMHWQSMNAQVKSRLEAGLEPPPGVSAKIRTGIKFKKG